MTHLYLSSHGSGTAPHVYGTPHAPCGRAFRPDCSWCLAEVPGTHTDGSPVECRGETRQHAPGAPSGPQDAQAAFAAGIETARQMALTAAVTIEVRDDAGEIRQRAAVAALQGLAEGLRAAFLAPLTEPNPLRHVIAAIVADPADSGTIECPTCKGSLRWRRDSFNGHLSGECKCAAWMQ